MLGNYFFAILIDLSLIQHQIVSINMQIFITLSLIVGVVIILVCDDKFINKFFKKRSAYKGWKI